MMVLLTYDVDFTQPKGAGRLWKVAKLCERYGIRVQNSVFEMLLDPAQLIQVKAAVTEIIDPKLDSVRIYHLGKKWESKVETIGLQKGIQQGESLIL